MDPAALSACRRIALSRQGMERSYVNHLAEAEAVVEVQGITATSPTTGGRALILRVIRGSRRVGEVIVFPASGMSNCDRPWLQVGRRGIVFLRRDVPKFPGFVSEDELRFLRRQGLLRVD
jgi:hypothetical protein